MTDKAPTRSQNTASVTLRLWSAILHSTLIVMHVVLAVVWARGWEHRVTVAAEHQKLASFFITASTTAFGTIYAAALVFVSQSLSMRRDLQLDQLLTTTHDNAAAWSGFGASILYLYRQNVTAPSRAWRIGVLPITLYLGTILGLHIATSSLFSLVTFNTTRNYIASTQGLPAYDISPNGSVFQQMEAYASGSLYFMPSILGSSTSMGLRDGSLYDVLNPPTSAPGNATVAATGFSVTCGYAVDVPELKLDVSRRRRRNIQEAQSTHHLIGGEYWAAPDLVNSSNYYVIFPTDPGVISSATIYSPNNSITLYSTIPIVDSNGHSEGWFNVTDPSPSTTGTIQIFQCSMSLVNQTATVDTQSNHLLSVGPDFAKTASTWGPYVAPPTNVTAGANVFIDTWARWYDWMPPSNLPLKNVTDEFTQQILEVSPMTSIADLYLIQKLNLPAANSTSDKLNVTLHDVENALSIVLASMFWTLGHISPTQIAVGAAGPLSDIPPPKLLLGSGFVTEDSIGIRLEVCTSTSIPHSIRQFTRLIDPCSLSIVAVFYQPPLRYIPAALLMRAQVAGGLAVSIILMALVLPMLLLQRNDDLPIDGTGILHTIWLYRNHPELETLLYQVEEPTVDNLRAAGMLRTQLVEPEVRKDSESSERGMGYTKWRG
ncbi:hypothetical protein C8R46DRAFT_615794 [Mycena filopes]|nr:hypothetical protein C8R46DRAFT_615794 [Mycena filopes]